MFLVPMPVRCQLHNAVSAIQVPLWNVVSVLQKWYDVYGFQSPSKVALQDQIRTLKRENVRLRLRLLEQQDAVELSQRLLALSKISFGDDFQCVPARVIYRAYESWEQNIVINRGHCDGVQVGYGVVCSDGIVGRVSHVCSHSATVELVTHPNFQALVKVKGDSAPYILRGRVHPRGGQLVWEAQIEMHDPMEKKSLPMEIETTRLGQQFPDHLPVGRWVRMEPQDDRMVGVVQLGSYLKNLDTVGVLIPANE